MRILVTGAAGFIGSHLSEKLLEQGHEVIGLDNLSSGSLSNLPKNKNFEFRKADIRSEKLPAEILKNTEFIFHLAADPLVKESAERPVDSFGINVYGTLNILEAARNSSAKGVVFTSTSAVYGDAKVFPTPESHPLAPISNYAASKISAESYVSSYSHTYGLKATVLRYANIFGPRSMHGVMHDFYFKLKKNPEELVILGNGKQIKSYLFVSDCVEATILAQKKQAQKFDIFNVGGDTAVTVDRIADEITKIMGLEPKRTYTGGRRGWVGDVSKMRLDVRKLKHLGWKPKVSLRNGIKLYLEWLSSHSE